jgi:DNA-binding FadR family transcriptional regulator
MTEEILKRSDEQDFLITSEHQLCRQFTVSRVTVRLALGDLEHLGLIYRRHGKGTFAYYEDCHVSEIVPDDHVITQNNGGFRAYALDPTAAEVRWKKSEELVGEKF